MSSLPCLPETSWFALQIRPKAERAASELLQQKGFDVLLPVYKYKRRWSDRIKTLEAPLFPGYSFCRFPTSLAMPVLTTPNVIRIVGIGNKGEPIPDQEIHWIEKISESGVPAYPWQFMPAGQKVRIEAGPLEGVEGYFVRQSKRDCLVVSVTLLQRSMAIEIDNSSVRPIH